MPKIHVLGGGTFSRVAPHLAIAARGNGQTARYLAGEFQRYTPIGTYVEGFRGFKVELHLTSQGDPNSKLVYNDDVSAHLDRLLDDPETKVIVMNCSMVDFDAKVWDPATATLIENPTRLRTDEGNKTLVLTPGEKVIQRIRKQRKDVFLVGFKQTSGATADEQYLAGLKLLKTASCNLVLANDSVTRLNMVITPEQARYYETTEREIALAGLVEMAAHRTYNSTFTRSTVVPGDPVSWNSPLVPDTLRKVVNHCITRGAYKPFLGSTVGHFAVKIGPNQFLTSRRKTDFNKLDQVGLVLIETKGDHEVIAHGSKPSVGGQSQRIVFAEHPDVDCIVHFHCPLKKGSRVPVRSQLPYECGSHQCGKNTSSGLQWFNLAGKGFVKAVMLDHHGPNIVFRHDAPPEWVIEFIEAHFDLTGRTDDLQIPVGAYAQPHAP